MTAVSERRYVIYDPIDGDYATGTPIVGLAIRWVAVKHLARRFTATEAVAEVLAARDKYRHLQERFVVVEVPE